MFGRPWAGAGCRALAPIQSIVTAATSAAAKRRRAVRTVACSIEDGDRDRPDRQEEPCAYSSSGHVSASAPDDGSCPPTAPPVLGTKSTCHGRGACAAGGAAPSAATRRPTLRLDDSLHAVLRVAGAQSGRDRSIEPEGRRSRGGKWLINRIMVLAATVLPEHQGCHVDGSMARSHVR